MVALQGDVARGQQHGEGGAQHAEHPCKGGAPVSRVVVVAVLHILDEQEGEGEHDGGAVRDDGDSAFEEFGGGDVGLFGAAHLLEEGAGALFEEGDEGRPVRDAVDVDGEELFPHLVHDDGVGDAVDVGEGDGRRRPSPHGKIFKDEVGGLYAPADEGGVGLDLLDEALAGTFQHRRRRGLRDGALLRFALREHKGAVAPVPEQGYVPLRDLARSLFECEDGHVLAERGRGKQKEAELFRPAGEMPELVRALYHGRDDVLLQQQLVREAVDVGEEQGLAAAGDVAQQQVSRGVELLFQQFFGLFRRHGESIAPYPFF